MAYVHDFDSIDGHARRPQISKAVVLAFEGQKAVSASPLRLCVFARARESAPRSL